MLLRYFSLRRLTLPRTLPILLMLGLLITTSSSVAFGQDDSAEKQTVRGLDAENVIADQYIVVFKDNVGRSSVASSAESVARNFDATVHHTYKNALNGFSATLSDKAVQSLLADPSIDYIEADAIVRINDTQPNPTWGLDRIDERELPLDNSYTYNTSGNGVHAYIIDTGVRSTHNEFAGRFGGGHDEIGDGNGSEDCDGHGTHVAGTVGGATYGVAKDVTIYAVRVLGCDGSGSNSGVIAGVDWVTANHNSPAVANMSLGGSFSNALNNAVLNSINAGVTFVVAAGNETTDACTKSPASTADAITVASSTSSDARSSFSNFGSCVDIFAPGSSITSAWVTNDSSTNTISGTSMASPHVAGVVALYLESNPTASPAQATAHLLNQATVDRISGVLGSPNRLLCTDACEVDAPPTPTPTPPGYLCSSDASVITDDGTTTFNLTVNDNQILNDLDVEIEADHTWIGDLSFTLTHVDSGTAVVLMDRPGFPSSEYGCSADNINATFDDASSTAVESTCNSSPAISGIVRPEQALSAFNGESIDGDWTLTVVDAIPQDSGELTSWCMIPSFADPVPTVVPTQVPTEVPTQVPTEVPTQVPTEVPTQVPTEVPTQVPTEVPTQVPTEVPTQVPTEVPTQIPTEVPTQIPTEVPTQVPTEVPTQVPTPEPTVVPPTPTDLVIEQGMIENADNSGWVAITLEESFTSPVVVASASYGADAPPVVVRVRNAVGSQFELKAERMDGSAEIITTPLDIYYIVVEEGVYNETDHGIKLEATTFTSTATDRRGSWVGETRSYNNSYTRPVVVGQVMSDNDSAPSVFWASGHKRTLPPTATTLKVGKHVAEDQNTSRLDETIGYIVIEEGSGTLNGALYTASVGSDTVRGYDNSPAYSYALPTIHSLTSAVVSSSGMDGGDGGWPILYGGVAGASNLNLSIDEDQFRNSERAHITEQVAYLAFGEPMQLGDDPMLLHGVVENVDNSGWTSVTVDNSYDSMIVVASANYDETNAPLVVRVRNAVGNQFDVMVARMDGSTDPIATPVDVYYMVVEEGVYGETEHGAKMEAMKVLSTRTDKRTNWSGEMQTYQNSYSSPVVVGQVMSANDAAPSQFWARGSSVRRAASSTALYVGKHVGEDVSVTRADETIGYVVFEAGSAEVNGIGLFASVGSDTVRGITSAPFTYNISGISSMVGAVVSSAGMDGNNGGWPLLYGADPFAGGLQLAIDEDQFADAERIHTTEQVAFVVFSENIVVDSATYQPSAEEETSASPLVAFTGQNAQTSTRSHLLDSVTIGENTFIIDEDTAIEGSLQADSRIFVIAFRNDNGQLAATFIRALSDTGDADIIVGRVSAMSDLMVEVDNVNVDITEITDINGTIAIGSHIAVVDSYDDGVLTNRNLMRLDSRQVYGTVDGFSDTNITIDGSTFNFSQDSYIMGALTVGEKAFVGLSEDGNSALVVNSNLIPTAVSLNGQSTVNGTATMALSGLGMLLTATWGVAYVNRKRNLTVD